MNGTMTAVTIGAAFGSKAPKEPEKEKCDCDEPAEAAPAAATDGEERTVGGVCFQVLPDEVVHLDAIVVTEAGGWAAPLGITYVVDRLSAILLVIASLMLLVVLAVFVVTRQYGFLVPGSILTGVGIGIVLDSAASGEAESGVMMLALAGGFLGIWVIGSIYRLSENHWWPLIPGGILTLIGMVQLTRTDVARALYGHTRGLDLLVVGLDMVEGESAVLEPLLDVLCRRRAGDSTEDDDVEQRVAHQPVLAVHASAHLARGEQARHVGASIGVDGDAAVLVVKGREDQDRLTGHHHIHIALQICNHSLIYIDRNQRIL